MTTKTETEERTQDETIEAGKRALRMQYREFCLSAAREMLTEAKASGCADMDEAEESIQERIHETADGCYWVIYTHAALDTVMASDNWLEIDDQGMDSEASFTTKITQAAYFAVCADLNECVSACADEFWTDED
jgi:hypothetical protein